MTHTATRTTQLAPTPAKPRPRWIGMLIALAVLAAAVLTAVMLWPDDDGVSTTLGDVTFSRVSDVPSDQIYAVVATPEGFLAASPATAGGVEFWTSEDGESWQLLVSEQSAFGAHEAVVGLTVGEAGFTAQVEPLPPLSWDELDPTTVWTSRDGETWHRSQVTAGIEAPASPYLRTRTWVDQVVAGPGAFVARGGSTVELDLEAVLAEVRPDVSIDDIVGFGVLGPPEPPEWTLRMDTTREQISVSRTELGLTPDEMERAMSGAVIPHLWWSADGVSWERREPPAGVPVSPEFSALVGTTDGFHLFFASPTIGFESADGRTWESFEMEGLPEPFGGDIVVSIETGFLAAGGTTVNGHFGGGPGEQSVWTTGDGRSWTRAAVELPASLSPDLDFDVQSAAAGPLGILARGTSIEPYDEPGVVLRTDDYALTLGSNVWTLADRATGDVIAEIDLETMEGGSVVVAEDEGILTFMDSVTGTELMVVTPEDITLAENEALASVGFLWPVVTKDGYVVTMSGDTWLLADEATGDVIASYQGPEVLTDEAGEVTLTDPATGAVLLIVTQADIEAASTETETATSVPEEVESEPVEYFAFSRDARTWDVEEATTLFGEGSLIMGNTAVGTERILVLVTGDPEAWMEYAYGEGEVTPPPVDIWIGEIAA